MLNLAPLVTVAPPKGRRPVPANCRVDELQVDETYQRSLTKESVTLIRAIANGWDWSLCQPLIVAQRPDGSLWIVDGQHRHAAAGLRGDILDLPCVIVPFPDQAAEAKAFVTLNTARKGLSTYAVFRAAVAAGDRDAVAIAELSVRHGLKVVGSTSATTIRAGELGNVAQLRRIVARYGEAILDRSLAVYSGAFGDDAPRFQGTLFGAIALLLSSPTGEEPDIDRQLLAALRAVDQAEWYRRIHERAILMGLSVRIASVQVLRFAALNGATSPAPPAVAPPVTGGGGDPAAQPAEAAELRGAARAGRGGRADRHQARHSPAGPRAHARRDRLGLAVRIPA